MVKIRQPPEDIVTYYTSEACPHFAIALHQLTKWKLTTLTDEANYDTWDGEEYPLIAHVFVVRPDGQAVDAKGPRSIAAVKKDFFDLEDPRVQHVSMAELTNMMGTNKPLYACSLEELKTAKDLIRHYASLYLQP